MADIKISDMMRMQMNLWDSTRIPGLPWIKQNSAGIFAELWMMEEMGECIAIIKKKGDSAIMREASVREAFVEEMSDVLMYYFDTLLRYGVTPEEISNAYVAKHNFLFCWADCRRRISPGISKPWGIAIWSRSLNTAFKTTE